jgi:hypothetical protein
MSRYGSLSGDRPRLAGDGGRQEKVDAMSEQDYDPVSEDDGVLEPADSLETDDLRGDILDTGVDAGEGYRGATRYGTTSREERRGESLDQLLAEEEPEQTVDALWTDEDVPSDEDRTRFPRSGRLVAPGEGSRSDAAGEAVAFDAGVDGGGAAAEEAAMHETDEPPFS